MDNALTPSRKCVRCVGKHQATFYVNNPFNWGCDPLCGCCKSTSLEKVAAKAKATKSKK